MVGSCVVPGISSPSQLYVSGQHSPSGTGPGMQFGAGGRQTFSAQMTSPSKQRQYLHASGGGTSSPNLYISPSWEQPGSPSGPSSFSSLDGLSSRPTVPSLVVDTAGSAGVVTDVGGSVLAGAPVLAAAGVVSPSAVTDVAGPVSAVEAGTSVVVGSFL